MRETALALLIGLACIVAVAVLIGGALLGLIQREFERVFFPGTPHAPEPTPEDRARRAGL